jgi:hypothetical protein
MLIDSNPYLAGLGAHLLHASEAMALWFSRHSSLVAIMKLGRGRTQTFLTTINAL